METKDWLLFVGPMLGIIVGGIIGVGGKWFEQRQVNRSQIRQIKLTRLEELHDLIMRYPVIWVEALRDSGPPPEPKARIPITFLQPPVGKVDMIVHLYFPELLPQLAKLSKLEQALCSEWFSTSRTFKDLDSLAIASTEDEASHTPRAVSTLVAKFRELENYTETFMQEISKISSGIVGR